MLKKSIFVLIIILYVGINVYSYQEMRFDKQKAIDNVWRTSEQELFSLAAYGGAVGTILAMYDFPSGDSKHKVSKASWRIGIVSLIINHLIILFILWLVLFFKREYSTPYFVARNKISGQLHYFKIGNVIEAKYITDELPDDALLNNDFYLIASKNERPWLKK